MKPVAAFLPWPLPALLAWLAAWALWRTLPAAGAPPAAALLLAAALGALLALAARGLWRRALVAGGFPLSLLAAGAAIPAWLWPLLLAPLLLAYPLRAWRDAPFFPTPAAALSGLEGVVALPAGARVLDAGCGLGHGLRALHAVWPQARLAGVEWSRPLAWLARWRCRGAEVRRGDMWAGSWAGFQLVYVFQRPESMARAAQKALRDMAPGSWLVSLEFEAPLLPAAGSLQAPGRRPVWVYRVPAATLGSTDSALRR